MNTKGRVTIPTDMDAVPETLDLLKRWGADAIRDCDGTEFPQELKDTGAKIYATYYTTRKDNAWAKANPDETQQCYIMTPFYTAADGALTIPLMTGISRELMKVNRPMRFHGRKNGGEVLLRMRKIHLIKHGNKGLIWSFRCAK